MTQVDDRVRIRLISQLVKDISRVAQKLRKYFIGTAFSAFTIPSLLIFAKNLALNLN